MRHHPRLEVVTDEHLEEATHQRELHADLAWLTLVGVVVLALWWVLK